MLVGQVRPKKGVARGPLVQGAKVPRIHVFLPPNYSHVSICWRAGRLHTMHPAYIRSCKSVGICMGGRAACCDSH